MRSINQIFEDLRSDANLIRKTYLKRPYPRSNVAIIEVHLANNISFSAGATSKAKSPTPKPKSKSEGGQFEPTTDSYSGRLMDTDAEYKALSAIADTLDLIDEKFRRGELYLYSERKPCESCENVLRQFKNKYPNIKARLFWDHPYPPSNLSVLAGGNIK